MSFIVKFCVTRHQFYVFQTFLHRLLSFLPDRDIKDMSKIVTKQKYLNFDPKKTLQK
jgi:hypothetical protein